MHVVMRQIYFTGVQAAPWLLFIGAAGGGFAVFRIVDLARQLGDASWIGELTGSIVLAELAPIVVTLFLLARSGVAVAAEIGSMILRREDLLLEAMGIPPEQYLFWPRFVGFVVAGFVLSIGFSLAAVWIGGLWASFADRMPLIDFLIELRRSLAWTALLLLLVKSVLYPALAIWMLLVRSVDVGEDPNMLPICASQGVLNAMVAILIAEITLGLLEGLIE